MKKTIEKIKSKKNVIVIFAAVIISFSLGYWLRSDNSGLKQPQAREHNPAGLIEPVDHEHAAVLQSEMNKEEVVYICPMNCVPPMAQAGKCPVCGMDLVAAAAQEHGHQEGPPRVSFSEETIKAAGIQVAPVEEKFVTAEIRLFGKIEYDPVEQYKVTAFAPGVIDRIYVKRAGLLVRKGDALFDMHSSELFFLEQEFFELLKKLDYEIITGVSRGLGSMKTGRFQKAFLRPKETGKNPEVSEKERKADGERLERIRRKMRMFGLPRKEIDARLVRGRPTGITTVTTPISGIVQEQHAFKGAYVNTGETIFTIADPRYKWARLDGYESDFAWIRIRQDAEFQVYAYPGETFKGKVLYVDPEFDPRTRTFKVGVLYTDPKGKLKPNMLVRCVIHARMTADGVGSPVRKDEGKPPLVIPDSAPLITGNRAVVYVQAPGSPGTFESREVVLGPRAKGHYVVEAGLKKGEMVVVNGNFKIDSAVQILAGPSMMEPEGGKPATSHRDPIMSRKKRWEEITHSVKNPSESASHQMGTKGGNSAPPSRHDDGSGPMQMEPKSEVPQRGSQHKVHGGDN
jgi:Cu(I)/Ag(I) efflux system membrane fusion protein